MLTLGSMARRLARTRFGQRALTRPDGLGILERKPTVRVYGGVALMAISVLTGLPSLALLSYLSVRMSDPRIIAIGGPVSFVAVHVMFGAGVYLAGQNYASQALLWATKRFLQKHA